MRVVLSDVVAVGGLVRVMTVDETQRRHVLLPGDVAVTAANVRVVSERGRVRARERITHVQLVLERHPDEQVAVTATSSTLCHLLDTSPRDHAHTHTHRRLLPLYILRRLYDSREM